MPHPFIIPRPKRYKPESLHVAGKIGVCSSSVHFHGDLSIDFYLPFPLGKRFVANACTHVQCAPSDPEETVAFSDLFYIHLFVFYGLGLLRNAKPH